MGRDAVSGRMRSGASSGCSLRSRLGLVSRIAGGSLALAVLGSVACVHYQAEPISAPQRLADLEARSLEANELGDILRAGGWSGEWPPRAWDVSTLTLAGLYYHPTLRVARATRDVAQAKLITAGAHPDPTASIAPGYNSTTPPSVITPWILTLGLDFTLETAGKRRHRVGEASHLADAARLHVATVAWQVRADVRSSALALYAARRTGALLERQKALQESVVGLLDRQLEAGAISPVEQTRGRLELDATRLAVHDAERRRSEARVRLAAAVGVSTSQLEAVKLDLGAFDQELPAMPSSDARRRALVDRPDILAALSEYAATQEALQVEIAKQYPDLHLGPGYEMDQSDNKWTLGFAVSLPVFNRNRGPIAEAMAQRAEAAARFDEVQAGALAEIDLALAGYEAALDKVAAARSMLDDQQRQVETTRARYDAGEISRLELLGAEIQLTAAEIGALDARVTAEEALGGLEDSMQIPAELPEWIAQPPDLDGRTGR